MTLSTGRLKVAGLQTSGTPGDIAANLDELASAACAAAGEGAQLLITPELFVTGYDIGDVIYELAAQDLLSPLKRIAEEHGIALVVGIPEAVGEKLYNSAVFVDQQGQVRATHRKTHLFGPLDRQYFTAGSDRCHGCRLSGSQGWDDDLLRRRISGESAHGRTGRC